MKGYGGAQIKAERSLAFLLRPAAEPPLKPIFLKAVDLITNDIDEDAERRTTDCTKAA